MKNRRWIIVMLVLFYSGMLLIGGALKPGYSHLSQYISELGASGSLHAVSISWLGFVPFGVLAVIALWMVAAQAPVRGISRLGYWLLLCEPAAWIGSALAPCDLGCPEVGSLSQWLHSALGLLTYLGTALGLLLLAFTPRIATATRVLWIALSLLWLLLFGLMVAPELHAWRGLLQRLAEWIIYGVLCISGWRLLGNPVPPNQRDPAEAARA